MMLYLRTFSGTPGKEVFYSVGIARLANDEPETNIDPCGTLLEIVIA